MNFTLPHTAPNSGKPSQTDLYTQKDGEYFSFVRKDIAPLLPNNCGAVLELGCGVGSTLAWLKKTGQARTTTGIELCAEPAAIARTQVDRVFEGDVDCVLANLADEKFNVILCLDVLEHLPNPWATVQALYSLLLPGGSIVISVPNIRHYSVVLPLLLRGTWQYQPAGIMDRTHLRFFTRRSAQDMLIQVGFAITQKHDNGVQATRLREIWKTIFAKTPLRDLFVFQFLIRAQKPKLPHKETHTS